MATSVLLVIADSQRRHRRRLQLTEQGYAVFATGNADTVRTWLQRHTPRLVVADCLLPSTRIAIPHLLKRAGHSGIRTIGIVADTSLNTDRARELLGFDTLIPESTPAVLVAKRALELTS